MQRPWSVICTALVCVLPCFAARADSAPVSISETDRLYILDNGIVRASVAKESGDLVSLKFKDLEMLATIVDEKGLPDLTRDPPGENLTGLNRNMTDHQYGFWSHDAMGARSTQAENPTIKKITIDPKANGGQRAEVSIKGVSNGRPMGTGPGAQRGGNFIADVEIRYTMGRGDSGVYTSCTFDHPANYAATTITEARCCCKLADMFDWLSVADDAFHNKAYPSSLREGDKYIYTTNQTNNPAFGWSSTSKHVGCFFINPSMEYMSGGPTKIEFLGHRDTNQVAAPCVLNYWRSSHYGGADVSVGADEKWSKTIGPFMIYVNAGEDAQAIYKDARDQATKEIQKWPFDWVGGIDYPSPSQRATVKGQLVLTDPLMPTAKMSNVHVGLTAAAYTPPGRVGFNGAPARQIDWQQDAKHYEFWVKGSDDGTFEIPAVRPGSYTMHAFADGVLGEFAKTEVKVEEGKPLDLGKITWTPVRHGKQLWDIGIPNRSGSEFFKGDVYYTPGIGATYASFFPDDITYVIGKSDFHKDWFFQHVPHGSADPAAIAGATRGFRPAGTQGRATPYTVQFVVDSAPKGKATLRAAFAGTGVQSIDVTVNDQSAGKFTRLIGDGVLTSHGSHGIWYEREVPFDASLLKQGENKLTLTVPAGNSTAGVIYDYLRLELDESVQ